MKMPQKEIKNQTASIKARLMNIAKNKAREFDSVLLQYFQERFLFRLSLSDYKSKFILKGALLLMLKEDIRFRPTRDIDLLAQKLTANPEEIKNIFKTMTEIHSDDNVLFDSDSIAVASIMAITEHGGIQVKLTVRMGNMHKILSMDIGFGDSIYGGAEELIFPTLLDSPSFKINCYSMESVIAEKFQALCWLNMQTSRMKDIFDIYFLAEKYKFKAAELYEAIKLTFANRETDLEFRKTVFSNVFKKSPLKQNQWGSFLRRNHLNLADDFQTVISKIEVFLEPLFQNNSNKNIDSWDNENWLWIKKS